MLGKLADSVVDNGGRVTGIIPEFFTSESVTSADIVNLLHSCPC